MQQNLKAASKEEDAHMLTKLVPLRFAIELDAKAKL